MDVIGEGSYGTVRVHKDNSNWVVKSIPFHTASSIEKSDLLQKLSESHHYLARVYNISIDKHQNERMIFITMKRYEGDVHQYIQAKNSSLSLSETLELEKQIGSALKFLHMNDILHADIKPQNILYDDKMNFYLTDFSISVNMKQERIHGAKQLYSGWFRPSVLNYNDQVKDFCLRAEFDYYALFMTLCYVHQNFILHQEDTSLYKCIVTCWQFKKVKFPKLISTVYKNVVYKSEYVRAFNVCF